MGAPCAAAKRVRSLFHVSNPFADLHPSARWNSAKQVWYGDVCDEGGGAIDLTQRLDVAIPVNSVVNPNGHKVDEDDLRSRRQTIERLWAQSIADDGTLISDF